MLMSMTGFGRGCIDAPFGRLIVEIQTVNRKHFEAHIHLPKELFRFENEVRTWVSAKIFRGSVVVRVQLILSKDFIGHLFPDIAMLKNFKKEWEKIAKELKYDLNQVNLAFIAQHMPVLQRTEMISEKESKFLQEAVSEALKDLIQMRRKEGKALKKDIQERLAKMRKMIVEIEKLSPESSKRMRQKLQETLASVLKEGQELDERILREVAFFAEKVDISEEISRMESHFVQFETGLQGKEGAVGRKMDFLVQEMGREINTIGSKSPESLILNFVIDLKAELEKIREQIQNIE